MNTIKQAALEKVLSRLSKATNYNLSLEQYDTPPRLAAALLYRAAQEGNVIGKSVADLGCGNGIFAIGSAVLGASKVYGVEKDREMITIARKNCEEIGVDVELLQTDVSDFSIEVDTMFMNPPFGIHKRGIDVPFVDIALKLSKHFYIILDYNAGDFLRNHVKQKATLSWEEMSFIEIPHSYDFHRKEEVKVPVRIARVDVW
ncbi:MAG: METTL5 family protein [Thermoplasmata archaeon]